MNSEHGNNIHWAVCSECQGEGKIERGPSRKRLRAYRLELQTKPGTVPAVLSSNLDVCLACAGSGLVSTSTVTPVDSQQYPTVAIVGGGIAGAALAVACLHRGIPCTLYERDETFAARSQGYGLTLQQASKAIAGLGIVSLPGGITSTRHVVHNPTGKIIGEWGLRKWQKPQAKDSMKRRNMHIPRQVLRSSLLENLASRDSVSWGHELRSFRQNEQGKVELTFQVAGDTKTATADLLVGADGIRSVVRELLIGEAVTPLRYLGCIVILGICPLKALAESDSPLLDRETVFQTVNGHERMYVMPYDAETIMWQFSFPLEELEAQALSREGAQAMKAEALRRLAWHSPIPEMLAATDESQITGYPVYDRAVLDPALLQEAGSVTLLGDAAHPMSPFKGQGANQALLDALTLARNIFKTCGPHSDWRERGLRNVVLNDFEAAMINRTTSKVVDSAKAVKLLHSDAVLHEGDEPRGRGLTRHL